MKQGRLFGIQPLLLSQTLLSIVLAYSTALPNNQPMVDHCQKISGEKFITYQEALDCYKSFPFNETIRSSTLETLRKTLPLYAFIDIIKKSPEPKLPSNIDLYEELVDIEKKNYSTEYDFQDDLTSTFRKLYDGHTHYTSNCFNRFIFFQPFSILVVKDSELGNGQKLIVTNATASDDINQKYLSMSLDTSKYVGAQILSINLKEPFDYLENYSNRHNSGSKDINARFNPAFTNYMQRNGVWSLLPGMLRGTNVVPEAPELALSLLLADGTVELVQAPYIAINEGDFSSGSDYFSKYCLPSSGTSDYKASPQNKTPDVMNISNNTHKHSRKNYTVPLSTPLHNPLLKGKNIQAWMVNNNTGVISINSFMGELSQDLFMGEFSAATRVLTLKGAENLILDLSNNEGGIICYGYYILDYLFPSRSKNRFNTDMHLSPLMLALMNKQNSEQGMFSYRTWEKEDGSNFNSVDEFIGGNIYHRGEDVGLYTSLFRDKCNDNPLRSKNEVNFKPQFSHKNMVVVTNSVCYSICSLLVNALQEFHDVPTITIGGTLTSPKTSSSLQGGMKYDLNSLLDILNLYGLENHHAAPKPFLTNSEFSFTLRQVYPRVANTKDLKKTMIPMEFTFKHSSHHLGFSEIADAVDPYKIWTHISGGFRSGSFSFKDIEVLN